MSRIALVTLFGLLHLAFPAKGQSPAGPDLAVPMAVADTLVAEILFPEGVPAVRSVTVAADSVLFGIPVDLRLSFAGPISPQDVQGWSSSAPWLMLGEVRPGAGPRELRAAARIHALDFFRIQAGESLGPVVPVLTPGADLNTTAPVRMPRLWRMRWWVLVLATLVLALLVAVGLWIWRRRQQLEPLSQWDPPPLAWIAAAPDLHRLLEDGTRTEADPHHFCDRLAGIIRRFLADRYRVHAVELTGPEILSRCRARGFSGAALDGLARLVQQLDTRRYDPEQPAPSWCREAAGRFHRRMAEVRILPRYTPVETGRLRAAEEAWDWLEQNLEPVALGSASDREET